MEAQMEALTLEDENLVLMNKSLPYNYDVIREEQIVEAMESLISDTSDIINLSRNKTADLLQFFKWDKTLLVENFFTQDSYKLSIKTGIFNYEMPCKICSGSYPYRKIFKLKCNHLICFNCWGRHIKKQKKIKVYRCAKEECDEILEKELVIRVMKGAQEYHRITEIRSFIKSNSLMKRCAAGYCTNVFKVEQIDVRPVKCTCGHVICMACGADWHSPVNCDLLKKWLEMMKTEGRTILKLVNSKCPKCEMETTNVPNTTNANCSACNFSYCWYCFEPWNEQWICCGVRQHRVGFFVQSYKNHTESLAEESRLTEFIENKKYEMLQLAVRKATKIWLDRHLWDKALEVLLACRKLLKYSYVLGFFLEENNQCKIFEDNQRDLDSATENLAKFVKGSNYEAVYEDLEQAIHFSNYCDIRRKVLLGHLTEGDRKKWWTLK